MKIALCYKFINRKNYCSPESSSKHFFLNIIITGQRKVTFAIEIVNTKKRHYFLNEPMFNWSDRAHESDLAGIYHSPFVLGRR